MKNTDILPWLAISSLFAMIMLGFSCSTGTDLTRQSQQAEKLYASGNYTEALVKYEQLIGQWDATRPREQNPYHEKAGDAAFMLENTTQAINYYWLSMQLGNAGVETHQRIIAHYNEVDNFSREMMAIESLIEKFPDGPATNEAGKRLFEMFVETNRWEDAARQWNGIVTNDIPLLEKYYLVNMRLDKNQQADSIAQKLLRLDKDNVTGLEWKAKKYYDRAEDRYSSELEAYERNKTRRQYAQLLEGYEIAGEDYRKARDIYEKLFNANPERRYAVFLYNIYARFQDESKVNYYKRFID